MRARRLFHSAVLKKRAVSKSRTMTQIQIIDGTQNKYWPTTFCDAQLCCRRLGLGQVTLRKESSTLVSWTENQNKQTGANCCVDILTTPKRHLWPAGPSRGLLISQLSLKWAFSHARTNMSTNFILYVRGWTKSGPLDNRKVNKPLGKKRNRGGKF